MTQTDITAAVAGSTTAYDALIAKLAATTDPAAIADLLRSVIYASQQDVVRDIVVDLEETDHDEAAGYVTANYLDLTD